MVTGDSVSDYTWNRQTPDYYFNCWLHWIEPFIDTKTRYAYLLGNHDAGADMNSKQIVALDQTNPYSLTQASSGINGTTNYVLPVYSSYNASYPSANLWVLDTNSVGCAGIKESWGCLYEDQIEWYANKSDEIRKEHGFGTHGIAFFHIPLPEYHELFVNGRYYGYGYEDVSCPKWNTGFFSKVRERGDISGMFCGHDHANNFGGWVGEVELVYGGKTGYSAYGPRGGRRNGRVIRLEEREEEGVVRVEREHWVVWEDLEREGERRWTSRVEEMEKERRGQEM